MGYVETVNLIFSILGTIFGLLLLHFPIFALVGLFAKKKYPHSDEQCKYGVIISARNEERVIARLIDSLKSMDYPQDKYEIFLVAHNCTDDTAKIAREHGATVYEYNNPNERTVGFAYKYLFAQIVSDRGADAFDGFLIMNSDNTVTENYLTKMNDAFVATGKNNVVTSYRNSVNYAENYMSCLYGLFFASACRFESRGRTVCGCSTRVSGTGYMFSAETVKNGWEYVTLTEDWEFSADQIACGKKVYYCDEAEFFDEQPTTVQVMWRQRFRWAKGHMVVFFTRFKKVVTSILHPKKYGPNSAIGSKLDIAVMILPIGVIGMSLWLLNLILLCFCPLFGYNLGIVLGEFFTNWAIGGVVGYVLAILGTVVLFICEGKRLGKVKVVPAILATLLFPLFLALAILLDVLSLFKKNVEWKVIPHDYGKKRIKRI